ncbi:hypothetical protein ACN4EE_03610 [Geminocystis sp. CENA526]|uniref:hypothetical protein n=1 Tax=Geminocystis sp. CENA526 TaxID=1355871 RepID=UPI003D6FC215
MKKTSNFNKNNNQDLLPEYDFDYQKAKPNRFALNPSTISITVTLDADVAKVFQTSKDVNNALRAIISAIPNKDHHSIL